MCGQQENDACDNRHVESHPFADSSSLESMHSGSSNSSSVALGVAAGAWLAAWLGALVAPAPSLCVLATGSARVGGAPKTGISRSRCGGSSEVRARSRACSHLVRVRVRVRGRV